jgi:hypothetical protein
VRTEIDRVAEKKHQAQNDVIYQEPNTITAKVGKHAQNTAQASDVSILSKARTILLHPVRAMDNRNFHHCQVKKIGRRFGVWCYG